MYINYFDCQYLTLKGFGTFHIGWKRLETWAFFPRDAWDNVMQQFSNTSGKTLLRIITFILSLGRRESSAACVHCACEAGKLAKKEPPESVEVETATTWIVWAASASSMWLLLSYQWSCWGQGRTSATSAGGCCYRVFWWALSWGIGCALFPSDSG